MRLIDSSCRGEVGFIYQNSSRQFFPNANQNIINACASPNHSAEITIS